MAAVEVLVSTGRAQEMILNPDETGRLTEVIGEGAYYGMQTFDQALLAHVQAGRVKPEDALRAANRPQDLRLQLAQVREPAPAAPIQIPSAHATMAHALLGPIRLLMPRPSASSPAAFSGPAPPRAASR